MKQAKRACDAVAKHPDKLVWAKAQHLLGVAYHTLAREKASINSFVELNRAIKCYQRALQYRTPDVAPLDYAETQSNLGIVYIELGDYTYSERAVECF